MKIFIDSLVGIVGTLLGAIGVVLTIISIKKNRKIKTVSWSDIHSATKYFWRKLKSENFEPTFIITPGQKGGIIAHLICEYYDTEIPVFSGFVRSLRFNQSFDDSYFKITTTKWNVYIPIVIRDYRNKQNIKVLIVDNMVMSGDFLYTLTKLLTDWGYNKNNIRSCTITVTKVAKDVNKASSYYWKVVDDNDYYFPWGKAE